MAPVLAHDLPDDIFECGLCTELVVDPTTLSCCGKTFCLSCLQTWLVTSVHQAGVPRCPAGCGKPLPFRLPPRSEMLQRAIESIYPEELRRRRSEVEEGDESRPIAGGFTAWQDVVAALDLECNGNVLVGFGTRGIVVGPHDGGRIIVKFNQRLDDSELCMNVTPRELAPQLPQHFGFHIGDRVAAVRDLMFGPQVGVRFGVRGTIIKGFGSDRISVRFDERVDGTGILVNVTPQEIQVDRRLVGGFTIGQKVFAAEDLRTNVLAVRAGTLGVVMSQYSDIRVTVQFDERADGSSAPMNVTAGQILPRS